MFIVLSSYMLAALLMSFAWIGHLKFQISLWQSVLFSMVFVLGEYALFNYGARLAHKNGWLTPIQTSFISLSMGAFCLFLVSIIFLEESVTLNKILGLFIIVTGLFFMHK